MPFWNRLFLIMLEPAVASAKGEDRLAACLCLDHCCFLLFDSAVSLHPDLEYSRTDEVKVTRREVGCQIMHQSGCVHSNTRFIVKGGHPGRQPCIEMGLLWVSGHHPFPTLYSVKETTKYISDTLPEP